MNNKKLFEEAIAEAKSIREAAIANAKEALEESLTPQIKSLLAQRLTEMEEEDSDMKDEDEQEAGDEAGADEEGEESLEDESEDEMELEDMSVEELKAMIRDIVGQMVDQDGDGDHDMEDHNMDEPEMGMEQPAGDQAPDDEIDLDELLAELAGEDEKDDKVSEYQGGYDPSDAAGAGLENLISGIKKLIQKGGPIAKKAYAELQMLGAAAASGMRESDKQELDEFQGGYDPSDAAGAGLENLIAGIKKLLQKGGPIAKKAYAELQQLGAAAASGMRESDDLMEAKKTVKQLTKTLQEVNLLNAKLLYANKVLKENKNLSDAQVANVVSTFDKATTAKEAKLVYESFSTTLHRKKEGSIVESKLRGLASKPVGKSPVKTEVISEVSEAVKRMQKLAGIIKG